MSDVGYRRYWGRCRCPPMLQTKQKDHHRLLTPVCAQSSYIIFDSRWLSCKLSHPYIRFKSRNAGIRRFLKNQFGQENKKIIQSPSFRGFYSTGPRSNTVKYRAHGTKSAYNFWPSFFWIVAGRLEGSCNLRIMGVSVCFIFYFCQFCCLSWFRSIKFLL
jgi:hypothetical protein